MRWSQDFPSFVIRTNNFTKSETIVYVLSTNNVCDCSAVNSWLLNVFSWDVGIVFVRFLVGSIWSSALWFHESIKKKLYCYNQLIYSDEN